MNNPNTFFEKHSINTNGSPVSDHYTEVFNMIGGFKAHWHPNIEIIQIVEGAANVFIDGVLYKLKAKDILIINSNCIHSFYSTEEFTNYNCIIIDYHFCALHELNYVTNIFEPIICNKQSETIYNEIINELNYRKDIQHNEIIKNLALVLIRSLYRNNLLVQASGLTQSKKRSSLVKQAIEYITNNYEKELSIESISRNLNISKYHLCHLFKDTTNQTINSYISKLRCEQAKLLLLNSNFTINEVANTCGFTDPSYFTKIYRKIFNKTPSEERKN